ncbi:hypothetical protein JXA29_00400 [Aerococcaceae bacterium zg-BR33]|nr:hypothetical protein [Aerococcaceae bacterium zg-A91]MBS4457150.1 hypothetical protein [Aerococcaceae bacterium zg-BR33]
MALFVYLFVAVNNLSLSKYFPVSYNGIKTYFEEVYPEVFNENIFVLAVDSLRTFYEIISILHRQANRVNGIFPTKYDDDVYKMIHTDIKEASFKDLDVLQSVIDLKKFYASNWAKYDGIVQGKLKLILSVESIELFKQDYESMKNMLFGGKTPFDTIISAIKEYEKEWNGVIQTR